MKHFILALFALCLVNVSFAQSDCEATLVNSVYWPGSFPGENAFEILDPEGDIVLSMALQDEPTSVDLCLEDGCYTINLFDSFGDGWNGGYLTLTVDGVPLQITLEEGEFLSFVYAVGEVEDCEPVISGCTDDQALNYNPTATVDDGSCEYAGDCPNNSLTIQMYSVNDQWFPIIELSDAEGGTLFTGTIWDNNYTQTFCVDDGCYNLNVLSVGAGDTGNLLVDVLVNGEIVEQAFDILGGQSLFGISVNVNEDCTPVVFGCTDPLADNYNANATEDNGSCTYPCEEGLITADFYLCTFGNGQNVAVEVTDEDGNIVYSQAGFNDMTIMYVDLCLDPEGCYTVNMTNIGDDTGWYNGYWWVSVDGMQIATDFLDDNLQEETVGFCADEVQIFGCTDPEALNYNPTANTDNGSCQYPIECGEDEMLLTFTSSGGGFINEAFFVLTNQETNENVLAGEYLEDGATFQACITDGCYTLSMFDSFGDGWNGIVLTADLDGVEIGSYTIEQGEYNAAVLAINADGCDTPPLPGCTDDTAINYNPNATDDDGSCIYPIVNDLCADAIAISEGLTDVSNVGAVINEGPGGDCWGFGSGEAEQVSVWYSFVTPDQPASIILESVYDGSNTLTDTQFGLYSECGGEMIFCDGNSGQGLMAAFYFDCGELEPNTTYYLLIDAYGSQTGTCSLNYQVGECGLVAGCTDPEANNYNPDATIDDGTCQYGEFIFGCTDPAAINFNPLAVIDDGTCIYPIDSCDATTVTFTYIEGTFTAESSWQLFDFNDNLVAASNYAVDPLVQDVCLEDGCYVLILNDSFGDGWNGGILTFQDQEVTIEDGSIGFAVVNINSDCEELQLPGCTDPEALNYSPFATVDDGSCLYEEEQIFGCTDMNALNYSPFATVDDGSCLYEEEQIFGCTDMNALNYNPLANIDDGSCIYPIDSCDATTVTFTYIEGAFTAESSWQLFDFNDNLMASSNYAVDPLVQNVCLEDGCYVLIMNDSFGDGWNGGVLIFQDQEVTIEDGSIGFAVVNINSDCEELQLPGCTDPEALNYSPLATVDDGSCLYEEEQIFGCTDMNALNYNPIANIDDGSCLYPVDSCDATAVVVNFLPGGFINEVSWVLLDANGNIVANAEYGGDQEFTLDLCLEDGCYSLEMYDTWGDGWNGGALQIFIEELDLSFDITLPDGEFMTFEFGINSDDCPFGFGDDILGCMDANANNYNPFATVDDGSCIYTDDCFADFWWFQDPQDPTNIMLVNLSQPIEGAFFSWDMGDGTTILDEAWPSHSYSEPGEYLVCLFVETDGCFAEFCDWIYFEDLGPNGAQINYTINVIDPETAETMLSVDELVNEVQLSAFPNPTTDILNLSIATTQTGAVEISIVDVTGKVMELRTEALVNGDNLVTLPVTNLAQGMYFVKLTDGKSLNQTIAFQKF